ncbi:hypothetical protein [Vibrio sp. Isolate24]|uniref:hypothetical protein n=1 Tax=Vibrio sp. Isolate24 TaxID=2908534 RepID=UPI001EFC8FAF|nr:hypothetical protein [Vibrio sp. Isolate24]MCG9679194.1 hypothetical protein [Vibrio sp. Isolate24]
MKKIYTLLFLLCSLLFSINSSLAGTPPFEGCRSSGCVGKIDSIYLHRDGSIKFPPPGKVFGYVPSELHCKLGEGVYFVLKQSHPHFKNTYSMLLTAHSSEKQVFARIVEGSNDCQLDYMVIY